VCPTFTYSRLGAFARCGPREEKQRDVAADQDQVDAQGVPDQFGVQWAGVQVQQGVLEIPDIPAEGRFVEGPGRGAGHPITQERGNRPRQDERQEGEDAEDNPGWARSGSGGAWLNRVGHAVIVPYGIRPDK